MIDHLGAHYLQGCHQNLELLRVGASPPPKVSLHSRVCHSRSTPQSLLIYVFWGWIDFQVHCGASWAEFHGAGYILSISPSLF